MNMQSCIKNILGGMSVAFLLVVSSCSDDSRMALNGELPEGIPASVYNNFIQSFPEATDVSWTVSEGYAVVTFSVVETRSRVGKTTVWYALKDGRRKMQCRTIDFDALPEAVRSAFAGSEYASWTVEREARLLTRYADGAVEAIYVLLAKNGESGATEEAVLYYTEGGVLVKQTVEVLYDESYRDVGTYFRDWLPQTPPEAIAAFVNSHYPQAKYLHMHKSREWIKVIILDGRRARMLLFDVAGNWLSTHTQLRVDELPDVVLSAFRSSSYAAFHIDGAKECLTAGGERYYLLTVKGHSGEKQEIIIREDGALDTEGETDEGTPNAPEEGNGDEGGVFLTEAEVDDFIGQRYPGASVTDRKCDEKELEVELLYNGAKIKVRFELHPQGYLWADSEWDLDCHQAASIPTPVQETLARLYADYQLYFLKYTETARGEKYYMAGLKSAFWKEDVKVKMDVQGNVLAEYGKP